MSQRRKLSNANAKVREAQKRVRSLQSQIEEYEKQRDPERANAGEREKIRKLVYGLRKKLAVARGDVYRAQNLVRYFSNPEIKLKQRERSRILMRKLRARRKLEAAA